MSKYNFIRIDNGSTKHIHINGYTHKSNKMYFDIDIFQTAFDYIVIMVKKPFYINLNYTPSDDYDIKICENPNIAFKINKMSLTNPRGSAADIIELFAEKPEFAIMTVDKLIFENSNRAKLQW